PSGSDPDAQPQRRAAEPHRGDFGQGRKRADRPARRSGEVERRLARRARSAATQPRSDPPHRRAPQRGPRTFVRARADDARRHAVGPQRRPMEPNAPDAGTAARAADAAAPEPAAAVAMPDVLIRDLDDRVLARLKKA